MNGKKILLLFAALAVLLMTVVLWQKHRNVSGSVPMPTPKFSASETLQPTTIHPNVHPSESNIALDSTSVIEETSPTERERMKRMADNLLKPPMMLGPAAAARQRAEWVQRFRKETDPLLRQEIITEMVQLDDPETVKIMMELLQDEKDSSVRQQIVLILGYLKASVPEIAMVGPTIMAEYQRCGDSEERAHILEMLSNLPTDSSVPFMQTAFDASDATAEDRFHAAEGLFKLVLQGITIDPELIRRVTDRLKSEAKSALNGKERLMAARALAAPGQDNKIFLGQLLATETNPEVRKFLALASQPFPTK